MTINAETRKHFYDALYRLAGASGTNLKQALDALYSSDAEWRGSHPLNEMTSPQAIAETVWNPLVHSFPDIERRDTIFVAGTYEGRDYIAAVGHLCGTFRKDWLTIPATGRPIYIRYGEVHEIRDGKIIQSNCLWDILDVIRQAGFWPIAPSLGTEEMWPGPLTADGVRLFESDADEGEASIAQTLAMHKTLADYRDEDLAGREGLLNMPQKEHWHDKMMWYGPAGIGTTRTLQGFVDHHQLPFRIAFPGRKGGGQWDQLGEKKEKMGGGHYIRIGDGPYSVTGGWPSVYAVHTGGNFLGTGPTGREVIMRVMDFYLHHEGKIRENWVPLDIIHLLLQMDVDVFDRMQTFFKRGAL